MPCMTFLLVGRVIVPWQNIDINIVRSVFPLLFKILTWNITGRQMAMRKSTGARFITLPYLFVELMSLKKKIILNFVQSIRYWLENAAIVDNDENWAKAAITVGGVWGGAGRKWVEGLGRDMTISTSSLLSCTTTSFGRVTSLDMKSKLFLKVSSPANVFNVCRRTDFCLFVLGFTPFTDYLIGIKPVDHYAWRKREHREQTYRSSIGSLFLISITKEYSNSQRWDILIDLELALWTHELRRPM